MLHWKPKRIIEKWLDEKTLSGSTFINPYDCLPLVREEYPLTDKEIWDYFFQLVSIGQLTGIAGITCYHDQETNEIPTLLYKKEHEVRDGQFAFDLRDVFEHSLTCSVCQKETIANHETIWMSFSPTKEYREILEEEQKDGRKKVLKFN